MGRLTPHFSDGQRHACIGAVLDGYSAREATQAAASGELGLEPFEVSITTIQDWVAQHERSEEISDQGREEADRARVIAQKEIARVEALEAPTAKDLHSLEQALRLVRRADRQAPRKAPPKPSSGPSDRLVALCADERECPPHTPLVRTAHEPKPLRLWGPGSAQSGDALKVLAGPCAECGEPLDREAAERCLAEWCELLAATRKRLEEECAVEEAERNAA